ncbi:Hypothetical predicted protein [Paramuricea clavata]|uniref:Uncharacterized protein n=1 Tax=Paramuricea clavata TaxID=317549 RepID=A0A6S7IDL4_PARCT|nr:Hypothetical predicted protein [Paramuricea clavata]
MPQEELSNEEKLCADKFASETRSLMFLHGNGVLTEGLKENFRVFHDFSVRSGVPMGSVLITNRDQCRKCTRVLQVDDKTHVIVIYHIYFGSYLGSRITKWCRKCKIYEHYGYWTEGGNRYFNEDCLEQDFLLTSEETAYHIPLLEECESLLVVGAVPFSTFASSYNRRFKYANLESSSRTLKVKRMKR